MTDHITKTREELHRVILWANSTDILFINGQPAELIDTDAVDYEVSEPRFTFRHTGESEEHDLDVRKMESAEWIEDEYNFMIVMNEMEVYKIECYHLEREDFPGTQED